MKMTIVKKLTAVLLGLFVMTSLSFGQFLPDPSLFLDKSPKSDDPREILDKMQLMFIEELFVSQLVDSGPTFPVENPIYDTSQTDQFYQSMYMSEIARMLADQDFLNFKYYFPEYR